jgi:hypothetical protein
MYFVLLMFFGVIPKAQYGIGVCGTVLAAAATSDQFF